MKIAKKTQNWMKPKKLTKKSTYQLSLGKGCSATNYFQYKSWSMESQLIKFLQVKT